MAAEGLVGVGLVGVGFDGVCEALSLFGQEMEMAADVYQVITWFNSTRQNICYNVLLYDTHFAELIHLMIW